ncbi:MAG: hypothetical protein H0U95_04465 [Bacteroidetes bacterium]|nr:hypothetical protein [Bacteroidota bacterium]
MELAADIKILKEISDRLCNIKLRSDGILQFNTIKNVEYSKDEAVIVINNIINIAEGNQYYILVIAEDTSNVTVEGMRLLSSAPAMSYALAKAYVINSIPHKMMANFYLKFLKPEKSVRFFRSQVETEKWLKSLKNYAI